MSMVVTLFESYGAGASVVGPQVAAALGLPFVEQAFSSEQLEATQAQQEQEPDGVIGRFLAQFGKLGAGMDSRSMPWDQADEERMVQDNTRLVKEAARQGGVILGHNSQKILEDYPGALHVMLVGELEDRISRAAQAAGIDAERAAKRQRHEDQVRAEMSIRLYRLDPRDPQAYDLVVNTTKLGLDGAATVIADAAKAKHAAKV